MKIQPGDEVIGHRGHGSQPENTLLAFRTGTQKGAHRIELDIQKSADGDYVVIHDPTVDRTTNGVGRVAELTTQQLRQLDAGKGEHLPLLSEVIDWAKAQNVALDIEVKHPHPGDEKELAQIVRSSGLHDPWVMSFDGAFVERFESLAPEVTTGILVHERPLLDRSALGAKIGSAAALVTGLTAGLSPFPLLGAVVGGVLLGAAGGYALALRNLRRKDLDRKVDLHIPGKRILNSKLVDRAHSRGKEVAVYTVDNRRKGQKFVGWGVDALITNYPERHLPPSS